MNVAGGVKPRSGHQNRFSTTVHGWLGFRAWEASHRCSPCRLRPHASQASLPVSPDRPSLRRHTGTALRGPHRLPRAAPDALERKVR